MTQRDLNFKRKLTFSKSLLSDLHERFPLQPSKI